MGKLWEAWKLGRTLSKKNPRSQKLGQPAGILKCRWCHKRLKVGSEVCHHCGREQHPASESAPDPGATAVKEVAALLERGGLTDKSERLRATVKAMELVHAGESAEDAAAAVLAARD